LREEPLANADHHGLQPEVEQVDHAQAEQALHELTASDDVHLAVLLLRARHEMAQLTDLEHPVAGDEHVHNDLTHHRSLLLGRVS
jgi:hypothetical protein